MLRQNHHVKADKMNCWWRIVQSKVCRPHVCSHNCSWAGLVVWVCMQVVLSPQRPRTIISFENRIWSSSGSRPSLTIFPHAAGSKVGPPWAKAAEPTVNNAVNWSVMLCFNAFDHFLFFAAANHFQCCHYAEHCGWMHFPACREQTSSRCSAVRPDPS